MAKKTTENGNGSSKGAQRRSYESPLTGRYGSPEMSYIFSPQFKFSTWRKLWVALAEGERMLGLPITDKQISQLKKYVDDVNFEVAEAKEKEIRHDVMSHVYAYGVQAPMAKGIIHLGATSAYVTDNTDLIQIRSALELTAQKLTNVIDKLANFADQWADLPTLAYTHFQAAQPTTVGKRACLWIQDLLLDLEEIERVRETLPFLGVKGTTGTQASFLELFGGDIKKVQRLEHLVAESMGFDRVLAVSGQTYTRKLDYRALSALCALAQSAHKFANDMRLLAHLKQVEEPFEKEQVGSSAMAYKRNPMRAERMDALSRHLIVNSLNPAFTAATQWFERTLDDSANRRIAIPEAFLAADAIALIYDNIVGGLVVHEDVIAANVRRELPFLMTENLMMEGARRGGDRQVLHERFRIHARAAADALKNGAAENDLFDRIAADPLFGIDRASIARMARPEDYTGLSRQQTERFLIEDVDPILQAEGASAASERAELRV